MTKFDPQVGLELQSTVVQIFYSFNLSKILANIDNNIHFRNKGHNCLN